MQNPVSVIGPYRILGTLGQGGMGVVYHGEHATTGQPAAIKTVLIPQESLLSSIRREIRSLARVQHPGVVRVLGEGVHDGLPWYTMELLSGQTLRQHGVELFEDDAGGPRADPEAKSVTTDADNPGRRRTGSSPGFQGGFANQRTQLGHASDPTDASNGLAGLSTQRGNGGAARTRQIRSDSLNAVLTLARRLCSALSFLHGEGLVHRDLKPDNVILVDRSSHGPTGGADASNRRTSLWPVLVDFGLATEFEGLHGREALELGHIAAGTVAYMAPEQFRGETCDARADLYALGCILYQLVTGRHPFGDATPDRFVRATLDELPLPPSERVLGLPPALDELVLRLLAKRPRDRIGHADSVAATLVQLGAASIADEGNPKSRAYLYRAEFSGRSDVLSGLGQQLSELSKGAGRLLLLGGESGVGKTRLMLELAREAQRRKIPVLSGECLPGTSEAQSGRGIAALQGLRSVLRAIADRCRERGFEETERLLGPRGKLLATYEPALLGLPGQEAHPAPAAISVQAARIRLFRALFDTLAALAIGRSMVLMLDDLQWADDLLLEFLEFLASDETLSGLPLLVVGAYRSEEGGTEINRLLEQPRAVSIRLRRLDESSVGAIVGDMLGLVPPPQVFVRYLSRHSEGNPFFVAEYLRTAVAEGALWRDDGGGWQVAARGDSFADEAVYESLPLPRSLRELVGQRLEALSFEASALLDVACVLGREMDESFLAAVAGVDGSEELPGLSELIAREVLEATGGGPIRFVHDKIREVAYARLDRPRRAELHRSAAEALTARRATGTVVSHAELGHHWEEAGEHVAAAAAYLDGARLARDSVALTEAARLYSAHLRVAGSPTPHSISVRIERATDVLLILHRTEEALAELTATLADARLTHDSANEVNSLLGLGRAYSGINRNADASQVAHEAQELAARTENARGRADALRLLARLCRENARPQEARALNLEAMRLFRELGERRLELRALNEQGLTFLDQSRDAEAREIFASALQLARELGDQVVEALAEGNLATTYRFSNERDEARRLYARSLALFRRIGDRVSESKLLGDFATVCLSGGAVAEAEDLALRAVTLSREVGDLRSHGVNLGTLGSIMLLTRRIDEAQSTLAEASRIDELAGNRHARNQATFSLAEIQLGRGQLDVARATLLGLLEANRETEDQFLQAEVLRALALLERWTGHVARGRPLLHAAGIALRASGDVTGLGKLVCEEGHAEIAQGGSGESFLERAQRLAESARIRPEGELGQAVSRLRRAVAAQASGGGLVHGECAEDLPEVLSPSEAPRPPEHPPGAKR